MSFQTDTSDFLRFIADKFSTETTPFLIVDLERIRRHWRELCRLLPTAEIYYAVKANPHPQVIAALDKLGSMFDIASVYELDQLLSQGIAPQKLSYGNVIKKKREIRYAWEKGVRIFTTDSEEDFENIAVEAPGSQVYFRIATDGLGSDWPLSKKFGSHPSLISSLLLRAKASDIIPYGISFHVGSQQRDIGQWDAAIASCKHLFMTALEAGIELKAINMGGGLPCEYMGQTFSLATYCQEIMRFVAEDFEGKVPKLLIEPGRSLVGDSGVLVTEVCLVSKKNKLDIYNWAYLDAGLFGGLIETLGEAIHYPIAVFRGGEPKFGFTGEAMEQTYDEVILAGPTCDSMDILYQDHRYRFPGGLQSGERLYFGSAGAYTASYCSVGFNGFPPLKTIVIDSAKTPYLH